jgi:hypothetical protein
MAWVIERQGTHMTPRGWQAASGQAQEAMDELMQSGLAALGGPVNVKETQ